MDVRIRLTLWWLLVALLIGCGEPAVTPTATPTEPAATPTTATATRTPRPTATSAPTATPTATPLPALIEVSAQTVEDDGLVVVDRVQSAEDAWLALFSGDRLLVSTQIDAGNSRDITLEIDPLALSGDQLIARLYDADPSEQEAQPLRNGNRAVELQFVVDRNITTPQLAVADQQAVDESGVVNINTIVSTSPGWLAVYTDEAGEPDDVVGLYYIRSADVLRNIPVSILWRQATPTLYAVLHADGGDIGTFEPDVDPIVEISGEPVLQQFNAIFPPDVVVLDQPVVDNTVIVDRAVSYGAGWLTVLYTTDEGQAERVVGFAPLEDGVNEMVEVEIVENSRTDTMLVQIHRDTGEEGVFEFPAADPPALYDDQVFSFPFSTAQGNYVVSADQPVHFENGRATVSVPLVVGDLPMWVAVRADLESVPGDVLGATWVGPGINRDVEVEIDASGITDRLHVVLHIDRDTYQLFEFPDGRDFELQRRFAPINAPFNVLR